MELSKNWLCKLTNKLKYRYMQIYPPNSVNKTFNVIGSMWKSCDHNDSE